MPTAAKKSNSGGKAMKPSGIATRSRTNASLDLPYTYLKPGRSTGRAIRPQGSPENDAKKKKKTKAKATDFGARKKKSTSGSKKSSSSKKPTRKVVPSRTKKQKSTTLVQPAALQGYRGIMVVSTMPQGGYPVGCGMGSHSIHL